MAVPEETGFELDQKRQFCAYLIRLDVDAEVPGGEIANRLKTIRSSSRPIVAG
jgi:hypothetical protein